MLHVHESITVLKLSKIELVMVLEINASFKFEGGPPPMSKPMLFKIKINGSAFYIRKEGGVSLADFWLQIRTVKKKGQI